MRHFMSFFDNNPEKIKTILMCSSNSFYGQALGASAVGFTSLAKVYTIHLPFGDIYLSPFTIKEFFKS